MTNPQFWRSHRGTTGPEYRGLALSLDAAAVAGAGEEPYIKEAAAQTYRVNDPVYFDSDGKIAICTEATDNLNSAILGLAAKAASGTTDAPAYVMVIHPDDEYLMQVFHSTPASAVTAQNQLSTVRAIIKDESGNDTWHIDIENTAEGGGSALAKVSIVGFPEGETINGVESLIGDQYGWAIVKFLEFTIDTDDGSGLVRNLQG